MLAVWRHVGLGWVMSITYVVAPTLACPSSHTEPVFMTLPGAYMTELPPSRGLGSTVLIELPLTSMTFDATSSSEEPATNTRPSESWNACGYCVGLEDWAPVSFDQVFV